MMPSNRFRNCGLLLAGVLLGTTGCESYVPFLPFFDSASGNGAATAVGGTVSSNGSFSEVLIQGRTFINGSSATTVMYAASDRARIPIGVDFNADGKIDPVVGYRQDNSGVVQILLSQGPIGTVDFATLSLDGNGRWGDLADVAVGDIDGDGAPDIVAAAKDGVVYLHNPGLTDVTTLRAWGSENADNEFLSGSTTFLTTDEIEAILSDVLPPGTDINNYDVTVEQGYANIEVANMDADTDNDVLVSRRLKITLSPKSNTNVLPIEIVAGQVQIFRNPGGAIDGQNWQLVEIGRHERYLEIDRKGAAMLLAHDMDADGDLDVVSAARDDDNVQLAWFENPGAGLIDSLQAWTQWRIGSLRDNFGVDIADLTGDGRPDVVATAGEQMQMILFEQPETGPQREYDWDWSVVVTFESYEPRDVKALDIDGDGRLELVVGGTLGALRYFESPSDPRGTWTGNKITDFDPVGDVGLLGYGDLDGDGDLDLVTVLNNESSQNDNEDRTTWIRNDL